MNYYRLDTMNQREPDFCVLDSFPEGMGLKTYKLSGGGEVLPGEYPEDAKIYMTDDEPGIVVPDLVGNTCNLLIVSGRVKDAMAEANQGPAQYLPVSIFNHKKRLAAGGYFIANPLGTVDVLDTSASEIKYLKGEVVSVETYVLDPKKLAQIPDLFRIKEDPNSYVVSERIVDRWRALAPKPTNIGIFAMEASG